MGVDVATPKFEHFESSADVVTPMSEHLELSADVAGDILSGVMMGPSC